MIIDMQCAEAVTENKLPKVSSWQNGGVAFV